MKIFILLLLLSNTVLGQMYEFTDIASKQRFDSLTKELRCTVCQNQNLYDSSAPLAKDLRDEIFNLLQTGQSNDEILQFLTDRYGDFVLYRPPLRNNTILLWLGPFILLFIGFAFIARRFKWQ